MKKAIQKPSDDLSKAAYRRVLSLVFQNPILSLVVTVVVVTALVAAAVAYYHYRTHRIGVPQKGVFIATMTVMKSQTGRVTDELSITLTDVKERSDPAGFVVMATVSYGDLPEMKISNAAEGYIVTYPKEHGYSIELLKANSVSAKFSISKNQ